MAKRPPMSPEQLKKARKRLGLTQAQLGDELEASERFITYRESGITIIDKMLKYAVCWMMVPAEEKKKYLKRFFG